MNDDNEGFTNETSEPVDEYHACTIDVLEQTRRERDALAAENARLSEQLAQANGLLRASLEALEKYGEHRPECEHRKFWRVDSSCTCGLDSAPQLPPAPTALENEGEQT